MGLDIYFHTITDSRQYKKYLHKKDEYDAYVKSLDEKYKKFNQKFNQKYNKWYSANINKQNIDWNKAPTPDFYTSDELFTRDNLQKELHELSICVHADYESQLSDLYMRKQNWMVSFVEHRHPELLVDSSYGKVLKNGEAILNKNDIKNLVKRMKTIKKALPKNWKYQMKDDFVHAVNNLEDICNENLPTMSRFFFGSTNYDRYYFEAVTETYLQRFEDLLINWKPGQKILYVECW